ncbi:MAG: aldose 1-epimerase [Ignavibacteriales bacterium]
MTRTIQISAEGSGQGPAFLNATVAPERGMLLLQSQIRLRGGETFDLLATPPQPKFGGEDDFAGNLSFSLGGAILLPYANRIRGKPVEGRQIETQVLGKSLRLPMNWGGKAEGAEQYAMHGLMLDKPFGLTAIGAARVEGRLQAGDFGGHWLSSSDIRVEYRLTATTLELVVDVTNAGPEPLPMGIGWHPWFNLPSGDRTQALLRMPARSRTAVNDYDEVLPTGEVLSVADTPYDFSEPRPLKDLYLDDCFTDLADQTAEVIDPAGGLGLRISGAAPVKAFQVYAPPGRPIVVVEPQFNLADPFGPEWKDRDTGMVVLQPGQHTRYAARVEVFAP